MKPRSRFLGSCSLKLGLQLLDISPESKRAKRGMAGWLAIYKYGDAMCGDCTDM
jgi:hypothetical protein